MVTLLVPLLSILDIIPHVFWEEIIVEVLLPSLQNHTHALRGLSLHLSRRVQLQLLGLLQQFIIRRVHPLNCPHLDGEGKAQSRKYNR